MFYVRGPFAKFVDSPYYSESEFCGGAVTVYYLPWQAMHSLQRSTYFSKTCCRPLITSKFLASELPFHGWKSPEIAWGEIWTSWRMFWWGSFDPLFFQTEHRIQFRSRTHAISGLFQPWKGSSEARNFEVINGRKDRPIVFMLRAGYEFTVPVLEWSITTWSTGWFIVYTASKYPKRTGSATMRLPWTHVK
jgi:hypothetical protein